MASDLGLFCAGPLCRRGSFRSLACVRPHAAHAPVHAQAHGGFGVTGPPPGAGGQGQTAGAPGPVLARQTSVTPPLPTHWGSPRLHQNGTCCSLGMATRDLGVLHISPPSLRPCSQCRWRVAGSRALAAGPEQGREAGAGIQGDQNRCPSRSPRAQGIQVSHDPDPRLV